ncbi:MAG TPA: poly-gamma-glutamate hydrolase family protein [Acidimicrobiales bacterium]|nr:poly-gamma-glutamate hydrolase family protein [Acidimicrobiales bacterium]
MRLRDLLDIDGVVEECELRSPVGFIALHGGSQDRGSDHIARSAARRSGCSLYAIVQPPWLRVHIPSHRHDPADSATLATFLSHVTVAISVHGYGRDSLRIVPHGTGARVEPYGPPLKENQSGPHRWTILGGRNRDLAAVARRRLQERLPEWGFLDDEARLGPLAGRHPTNPVNLPPRAGVQVELPPGLRGIGTFGDRLTPRPDDPLVERVVSALVETADAAREQPDR